MKHLLFLTSSLLAASPALAQERAETITVVATGQRLPLGETGQSIAIAGAGEIGAVQGADLTRVLDRLPGVTLVRNGGLGSFTGLFVRGASSEQLLVILDGVRLSDVASPGVGYDLGNMLIGGIGKIELLRGSNSVVWGSRAIGGVLALTSREIAGVEARAEYGSHATFNADALAGIVSDRANLTVNGGYAHTDGISAAASGTEPDGFRQWRIGGRGRAELGGGFTASLAARYADGRLDLDGFPAPTFAFADTREYSTSREASGRAQLGWQGPALDLALGFALSDTRRANYNPAFGAAPGFTAQGRSERIDLGGRARLGEGLSLTFGADSEWSRYRTTFDSEKRDRLASGHALLSLTRGPLMLSGGLRLDDHSRFGSQWTFGANGSLAIAEGWRLRASYGEGFKAPTLFQLFSDFGNQSLRPERSRSYDVGIEKGDRNGPFHAALTLFRRDSRDLIDFVSCFGRPGGNCTGRPFGTYDNVGQARAEGIELELGAALSGRLSARGAYSYVKAVNRGTGTDLARRPRHALSLGADWRPPLAGLTLGADLRVVSASFDNAANTVKLAGYEVLTLRASLPVTGRIELFGRVENVADVRYQTVAGYSAYGRTGAFGARARF